MLASCRPRHIPWPRLQATGPPPRKSTSSSAGCTCRPTSQQLHLQAAGQLCVRRCPALRAAALVSVDHTSQRLHLQVARQPRARRHQGPHRTDRQSCTNLAPSIVGPETMAYANKDTQHVAEQVKAWRSLRNPIRKWSSSPGTITDKRLSSPLHTVSQGT